MTAAQFAQITADALIAMRPATDHLCMQVCAECDHNTRVRMARNRVRANLSLTR
jgi:hypothetical protein